MQNLRRKLVLLFVSFTLLPLLSLAAPKCLEIFEKTGAIEKDQRLDNFIRRKRSSSLKQVKINNFSINNVNYEILGLLGQGSSSVYLALSPKGLKVVIKHIKETEEMSLEWINSIYYEVAVTQYYLSQSLIVPKIVDYEIVRTTSKLSEGFLVKEYREGLTREEFLEGRGLGFLFGLKYQKIESAYKDSEKKMVEIHSGFQQWLKDNKVDLYQHRFAKLNGLINHGDHSGFGYKNWLFDIETYKWVVFDP